MGNNYYDAWKRGDFKLEDMVTVKQNLIWGANQGIVPLKELSGLEELHVEIWSIINYIRVS